MSSTNSLKHGVYASRAVAIDRGRFAEDPDEIAALIDGVIEALRPRDALEHEVAHRIALASLRLRRLGRFEALALAGDGTQSDSGDPAQALLEQMDGVDTSPEGRREQAAARVLRETLERVTRIEARTSQGLDRALLLYAKLQERSVNDVPAIDGYGGNEPN